MKRSHCGVFHSLRSLFETFLAVFGCFEQIIDQFVLLLKKKSRISGRVHVSFASCSAADGNEAGPL